MWTTFKAYYDSLKDKGLYKSFVPFNKRACNDYANKHYLAYCINNFPRTLEYGFYASKNVILNSDMYALSILVQWVFRSAIRKGEEIWVYIPSKRMRWLLMQWIKNLCEGNDLKEIRYIDERRKKHSVINKESEFACMFGELCEECDDCDECNEYCTGSEYINDYLNECEYNDDLIERQIEYMNMIMEQNS